MSTSPEEQKDPDKAKAEVEKLKIRTYDLMKEYARMSPEELKHSGHKTPEGACLSCIQSSEKEIAKIWKEFLKRWPDK